MNKKMLIGVLSGVVVLGAGGLMAFEPLWASISPLSYVGMAIANTEKQLEKEVSSRLEVAGMSGVKGENYREEIKIDNIKLNEQMGMGNMFNDISLMLDMETSKGQSLGEIILNMPFDMNMTCEVYMDQDLMAFRIPETMKEFLTTEIGSAEGVEKELESYPNFTELLKKEVVVEYEGKGKENGESVRKFKMTLPEEAVETVVEESVIWLLETEVFEEQLYLSKGGYYTKEEIKEEIDYIKSQFKEGIKEIKFDEGLVVQLAVNGKHQLVGAAVEVEASSEYSAIKTELEIAFAGGKVMSDLIEVGFVMESEGEKIKANMAYESNLGAKPDVIEEKLELSFQEPYGTEIVMGVETESTVKEKANHTKVVVEFGVKDQSMITIKADGTSTSDQKAKTVAVELKDIEVLIKDITMDREESLLKADLSYSRSETEEKELKPSNMKSIDDMSPDEVINILGSISDMGMIF